MTDPDPLPQAPTARTGSQFGYFVVQTQAEVGDGEPRISGVLENLWTGERRPFGSPEELGHLVRAWSANGGAV